MQHSLASAVSLRSLGDTNFLHSRMLLPLRLQKASHGSCDLACKGKYPRGPETE